MLRRLFLIHAHHVVARVGIPVTESPRLQELRAAARQRRDALHIPAWEPYGHFPTRGRVDVQQTWRDKGWRHQS